MFSLEDYYIKASSGNKVDNTEILEYIREYKQVVLWGASYLGNSVAEYLVNNDITDFIWWDMRFDEIGQVHSVPVQKPFTGRCMEDKEHTLIIFCIGNTSVGPNLRKRLKEEGFSHILRGEKFFMGAICPYDSSTGIDGLVCNGSMTCRSMFCARLQNIVKKGNDRGGLFLENLTFMITSHCSLKCKYCCAYINSYPMEKKQFYSCEQICDDIDRIFGAVDAVGSITIQGGEPFLHPDIDKIVGKLLSKKNFGIVSIATNGIFRIDPEKLKCFCDNRLNIAFSGYYDALPKETLDIYYRNVELMKQKNIPHTVGVRVPEWSIPPTLWNRHYSEDVMKSKKEACKTPERCMQVVNGRLYPCIYSASLHEIGVADYPNDYLDINDENLTERIQEFMERPFYNSCGHCGGGGKNTNMAGEQGFYDFVTPEAEA